MNWELARDGVVIASGSRAIPQGRSQLALRDLASVDDAGEVRRYTLRLSHTDAALLDADPMLENNQALGVLSVAGQRRVLVIGETPDQGLVRMLQAAGVAAVAKEPPQAALTPEQLAGADAVILENVAARQLPAGALARLAAWVEGAGGGVLMTGGERSFGPGGYYHGPLDPVLPVSMELRHEHRKMQLAVVAALDRSGSMGASVGGGMDKMDLANLGASEVVGLLGPLDAFGCLAVDTLAHTVVPLSQVENVVAIQNKVRSIDSQGGGIYIGEALDSAYDMLHDAPQATRHVVIFADAADSENPGHWQQKLRAYAEAGMTVSVIGLGTPGDPDVALLQNIALLGGGQCYFTTDPHQVPQLFIEDTFQVARSAFVPEPTPFAVQPGWLPLTGQSLPPAEGFPVGGVNMNWLREGASMGAITQNDAGPTTPLLASWQIGTGRAATWSAEVNGEFTGAVAQWPGYGQILTGVVRWAAGASAPVLPRGATAQAHLEGGQAVVRVHLDPASEVLGLPGQAHVTGLTMRGNGETERQNMALRWHDATTLEARLPMTEGVLLPAITWGRRCHAGVAFAAAGAALSG